MDINDNISPKGGYYYNNELYYSQAYRSLSKAARDLLHCLLNELRWANNKKKKKRKKVYLNNSNSGGVSFTEVHFKELHGYCSATYLNARNQLIEVGFIKQNYRGGMCRGDCARYRLLCVDGVRQESQRWRRYPEENWSDDIPKLKKQMVGVKTQFKKGKSGRKTKATL